MTAKDFVDKYYTFAKQTELKTGIPALSILAQSALETGYGKVVVGNMMFGIKDTDGVNGNEQLLTTTEYSRRSNLKFPVILSITPVIKNGVHMFKYKVKDYFRKYSTPEESFTDHANFFIKNKRYSKALVVKNDPYLFLEEISKAGYATAPDYYSILKSVAKNIEKYIPKNS